jgi:hypothetical protein
MYDVRGTICAPEDQSGPNRTTYMVKSYFLLGKVEQDLRSKLGGSPGKRI